MFPNLSFGSPLPGMAGPYSGVDLRWGSPPATAPTPATAPMGGGYGGIAGYGLLPGPAASVMPGVSPGIAPGIAPNIAGVSPVVSGMEGPVSAAATAGVVDPTAAGGWLKSSLFNPETGGLNFAALGDIAKGIGGFGSLYLGMKSNSQAEDALACQKKAYKTNLGNSISSYNMALEDRMRSRAVQQGDSSAETEAYIQKHKLGKG